MSSLVSPLWIQPAGHSQPTDRGCVHSTSCSDPSSIKPLERVAGVWGRLPDVASARSKKRAEYRRDLFDDYAQAQIALAQLGVQFCVRAFGAFQDEPHV